MNWPDWLLRWWWWWWWWWRISLLGLCSALLHRFSTPMTQPDHVVVFIRKPPLTVYSPQGCKVYVTLIQQISPFALFDSFVSACWNVVLLSCTGRNGYDVIRSLGQFMKRSNFLMHFANRPVLHQVLTHAGYCRTRCLLRSCSNKLLLNIMFRWPCIVKVLIIKPTKCTNFLNLFLE